MVKRYFLRHSHLWNRRDGWRTSSCKPRRQQEMFFLITPSNPPAILKQPGHDSANWLCWLDIHHSCRDTAKENARRRRRALRSSAFLTADLRWTCLQLFKLQTHKYMTSCRVYVSYAWTSVIKGFKNIWTADWQAVVEVRSIAAGARIKGLALIPGCWLDVWQLFHESYLKKQITQWNIKLCDPDLPSLIVITSCKPVVIFSRSTDKSSE